MSIPSTRQLVAVLALAAIVCGAAVGLYALTPVPQRVVVLDKLGGYAPGIVAAIGLLATWLGVRKVQADHGAKLDTITAQTNGVLTQRIQEGAAAAIKSFFAVEHTAPVAIPTQAPAPAVESAPLPPTDPPASVAPAIVGQGAIH